MEELFTIFKTIPLTFTALFPVVNPIGCSVLFLGLTEQADHQLRKQVAKKVAIYTFSVLTIVLFAGIYILQLFGISIPVIEVCGGLVIAVMGWNLLGQGGEDEAQEQKNVSEKATSTEIVPYLDQAFYPFTFPFTVGPGVIAVMLAVSAHIPKTELLPLGFLEYIGAVIGVLIISTLVYFGYTYAQLVVNRLTPEIRKVIMRILSFIMVCIGAEIMWTGVLDLAKQIIELNP